MDAADLSGICLPSVKGDIKLREVDFAYPARPDVPIFSKLCFHIQAGRTAALVGESGSGKSTVIQLIERFYDPQSGEVSLDGIDIKLMQVRWLRQQIGLVSQEPVLFGTTIMENIAYGKDGATMEEIVAAARLANAGTFIDKMPQVTCERVWVGLGRHHPDYLPSESKMKFGTPVEHFSRMSLDACRTTTLRLENTAFNCLVVRSRESQLHGLF